MTATTTHPTDALDAGSSGPASPTEPSPRGWAWAGLGAGLAGIGAIVGSSLAGAVYDGSVQGDAPAIVEKMSDEIVPMLAFHTFATVSALLLLVFAAGLRRRLRADAGADSLLPDVTAYSLLMVSVTLLMGSALTTEFVFGLKDPELLVPETAVFFGHWVGTVPWVWAGAGAAALALGVAGRRHATVPTWLTWTSLVLGGLTTLLAISPLQYMAGMTGPVWLTVAAVGLLRRR